MKDPAAAAPGAAVTSSSQEQKRLRSNLTPHHHHHRSSGHHRKRHRHGSTAGHHALCSSNTRTPNQQLVDTASTKQDKNAEKREKQAAAKLPHRYHKPEIFDESIVHPPHVPRDPPSFKWREQTGESSPGVSASGTNVYGHDAVYRENSRESSRILPGAVREGGNQDEDEETLFTRNSEVLPVPNVNEEMHMVSAHMVEEPVLVSAVKTDDTGKWWTRPRNRVMVVVGVLVIVAGLVAGVIAASSNNDPDSETTPPPQLPGVWRQLGEDIVGETAIEGFGSSISLSADGNTLAVGAIFSDSNGDGSGSVRVFNWLGDSWTQKGPVIAGEAAGDNSGWPVALSANSNVLAVGAYLNDGQEGSNSGHVRLFEYSGDDWTQVGSDLDGEAAADEFGTGVALSVDGSTLVVGGDDNDGNGESAGHVRVFGRVGEEWIQVGEDIDGEMANDKSGWSVSVSQDGTVVAIGAIYNGGNGIKSGQVRVFVWTGDNWMKRGEDIDGAEPNDQAGYSVSLSTDGDTVSLGTIGHDADSGLVRVLDWNGESWEHFGQDIVGKAARDGLGWSVSLSAYGTIIAIGAPQLTGGLPGYAQVFRRDGNSWFQIGQDIVGKNEGELCGWDVSLSADGSVVAVASPFTGHVRVYKLQEA